MERETKGKRERENKQTRIKYHPGQLPKSEQVLTWAADSAKDLNGPHLWWVSTAHTHAQLKTTPTMENWVL